MSDLNDDPWTVEFETRSRDGAIKACTILARGLNRKKIASSLTKFLVKGSQEGGKTLIVDAIIRELIDDESAFNMPLQSMLEVYPCQAVGSYLSREFKLNKSIFGASLYRLIVNKDHEFCVEKERMKTGFPHQFHGLLEFEAAFNKKNTSDYDIIMDVLSPALFDVKTRWNRKWSIRILNSELQTPEMKVALDQLRTYESRRQQRIARTPS